MKRFLLGVLMRYAILFSRCNAMSASIAVRSRVAIAKGTYNVNINNKAND